MFRPRFALSILSASVFICAAALAQNPAPNDAACTLIGGWHLNVARAGNGSGKVAGLQIDCGSDCGGCYPPLTPAALTATPAAGSFFAGWTGDYASTSGNTCVVNS